MSKEWDFPQLSNEIKPLLAKERPFEKRVMLDLMGDGMMFDREIILRYALVTENRKVPERQLAIVRRKGVRITHLYDDGRERTYGVETGEFDAREVRAPLTLGFRPGRPTILIGERYKLIFGSDRGPGLFFLLKSTNPIEYQRVPRDTDFVEFLQKSK